MFLLTLGACRAEDELPIINKENCYQLQFGLSILPPQTRALTEEPGEDPFNENKITSMDAFIYDGAGTQQGHYSMKKGDLVVNSTSVTSGTATIYVPKDNPLSDKYNGHNYDLYVLVNYHGGQNLDNMSLNDLKKVVETSDGLKQTTIQKQDDFLMDGNMKTGTMTWATSNNYNITTTTGQTLKLARAAAKIRIRLDAKIVIEDHKDIYDVIGEPTITFKSFTNQTSIFAGNPVLSPNYLNIDDEQQMVQAEYGGKKFWTRSIPYYSYENDWTIDGKNRTYAVIKLRVKSQNTQKESDSYYSVPINYLAIKDGMSDEEKAGLTKLQRNHLYDIECSIKQLGSAEPTKPVDIPPSYIAVEDWNNPDGIDAAITKAHYLVVKELHPEMLNIDERLVEYVSDLDIDVPLMNKSITSEYTQYNTDGSQQQIYPGNKGGDIKVETIVQNGKKYLKIISPIPDNYVPLTIRFRVTQMRDPDDPTATPLFKNVEVTQYPPIYVTAKHSKGTEIYWYSSFTAYNPKGPGNVAGHQHNETLFTVTTLAPQAGQIVGDPTFGTDRTDKSEEANKITSPQFIIASQWGMSTQVYQYSNSDTRGWNRSTDLALETYTGIRDRYRGNYRYYDYNSAEERAYNYWEDDYGVSVTGKQIHGDEWGNRDAIKYWSHSFKHEGHWRIPTLAELELIVKIQSDPKSAVKSLLWGYQYWSACEGWAYRFVDQSTYYQSLPVGAYKGSGKISIRPVFDTYNKSE